MKKLYLSLALALGLCCGAQAQNNWMQYLPDDAYVVDVSIPGAHDAATGHGWSGFTSSLGGPTYGTTQDINIPAQWNLGVRAFDLRPQVNGSRLAVNHGVLQTKLYFDDALKMLCDSLKNNPSEFIVIHMLYADGFDSDKDKYSPMLKTLLETEGVKEYLIDFRRDLTVKDMRGKMLIISRDPYDTTPYTGGFFNGWSGDIYWNISISGKNSSAPLNVQDVSTVYGREEEKKAAIIDLLNYSTKHVAATPEDVVWSFNLPSGYNNSGTSQSNGYRANAANTHPVFIEYMKENPAGPTGVVLMDYVGVDNSKGYLTTNTYNTRGLELLNDLIANNWRYQPQVKDGKTISVPYYAYKTTGWTSTTGNTLQVNTWSEEGLTDGSGMVTPFYENWRNKGGRLGNGEVYYTLSDCQKGYYKVTIRTRLLNEAGGEVKGAEMFANGASISLQNGKPCTNGFVSNYSLIGTVDEAGGELKFGFRTADATFNWIAFNHVDVEYLGDAVTEADGGDLLLDEIYNKDVKAEYQKAQDAFKADPSQETYNAMSEAYREAEASIEAYRALKEVLDYADSVYPEASKEASDEAKAEYEGIVGDIKQKYEDGEYLDSEIESVIPQIYAALAALAKTDEGAEGIDMTSKIVNPSFEMGNLTGWSVPTKSDDTGVKPQSDATYTTEGCDGDYLFNTWWQGVPITQTVAGLPNGRYRLTALLASENENGAGKGNAWVFLTANGGHNEATVLNDKTVFVEASYEFDVTDGTATIGAVGGNDGGTFTSAGWWWYKADNFRLTFLDSYLSAVALPFPGEGEVEAGKWYVYDAEAYGCYDFSTAEGIETAADGLLSEIEPEPLAEPLVRMSAAGQIYFRSATTQALAITRRTDALTIAETEYVAYVTKFDVDFAQVKGITAYKVTEALTNSTKLETVNAAPAGTALILKGAASDYTIPAAIKEAEAIDGNLFLPGGSTEGDGKSIYVLGSQDGVVAFYLQETGVAVPADKGYIAVENEDDDIPTFIPLNGTRPTEDEDDNGGEGDDSGDDNGDDNGDDSGDDGEGEEVGIGAVAADGGEAVIYNLSGQRVQTPAKGIYIVNGKKVVVK